MKLWRFINTDEMIFGVVIAETKEEAIEKYEKRIVDTFGEEIPCGVVEEWKEDDETEGILLFH